MYANTLVFRMQYHEVVNAALKAYHEICRKADCGEHPLYRPYDWNMKERNKAKSNKVGAR